MDTAGWASERFEQIVNQISLALKQDHRPRSKCIPYPLLICILSTCVACAYFSRCTQHIKQEKDCRVWRARSHTAIPRYSAHWHAMLLHLLAVLDHHRHGMHNLTFISSSSCVHHLIHIHYSPIPNRCLVDYLLPHAQPHHLMTASTQPHIFEFHYRHHQDSTVSRCR